MLPVSSSHPSRPIDSESLRETTRKVTMLDEDTEGRLDTSYEALKPTLKRCGQDDPNNQATKRACTRDYTPITSKQEYIDHEYEEANDLGITRPEEKGLAVAIEATRHARSTTFNLAPMTAKDLAIMQQDWASDGFPSLLAETVNIGRAYTTSMSKYFDNALDLLSLLKQSGHGRAGHMKVQLDCVSQKGKAVPEQPQNGRIPNLSNTLNGEVDVQHLHEQEDTMHDRSQDAKAFDRPILSTGNIKIDLPSHPELAALDRLHEAISSERPVAMTEKAQVDRLCQPTAATVDQVHNQEVSDSDAPVGPPRTPTLCEDRGVRSMGAKGIVAL